MDAGQADLAAAAATRSGPGVGPLLREWRKRRRLTQLDLALDAGVSPRHLSFVETGRSRPSPEMVLLLADQLEIPFRERNRLLLAAGHAPTFPERLLDEPQLAPVRGALDSILTGHEPNPGLVFDRAWNLVAANSGVQVLTEGVDSDLLEPPVNVLRVGLHPRGIARRIVNLAEVRAYFLERLRRQVETTGDAELTALLEEMTAYPAPPGEHEPASDPGAAGILAPIRMRTSRGGELSFFSMIATFGTPVEVTTSELVIELAFPADPHTAAVLENLPRR